jgi:signal transduction histidine kinase
MSAPDQVLAALPGGPALGARLASWVRAAVDVLPIRIFSLQARMVGAFAMVIFLTLLLTGGAVVWLIQDYRIRIAVDHLSDLAVISTFISRQMEDQALLPDEIASFVSGQVQGEAQSVLVLDEAGKVVAQRGRDDDDQGPDLLGRKLTIPTEAAAASSRWGIFGARARLGAVGPPVKVWEEPSGSSGPGHLVMLVTADLKSLRNDPAGSSMRRAMPASRPASRPGAGTDRPFPGGDRQMPGSGRGAPGPDLSRTSTDMARMLASPSKYQIVLATPSSDVRSAWRELAPRLSIAAVIAFLISVAVASALASTISRPIARITEAARRVADGDLSQRVPGDGRDEIAQLANTFNHMATQIAQSQQSLRDFVADASHELRTPLTSIQGFAGALLDGALTGEEGQTQAALIITEESRRMSNLVEDLLYLSRVEALRPTARQDKVSASTIVNEIVRRLTHLAEVRNLSVNVVGSSGPMITGDPGQLDHLVGNLLENAIKYTPDGGTITITTGHESPASRASAGARGFIRVHNTGTVIPEADLPHIFDRFYRVDKSRARVAEGSGLGLAIAKEIARRHGGDIQVTSTPATGTTFTVFVPCPEEPPRTNVRKPYAKTGSQSPISSSA